MLPHPGLEGIRPWFQIIDHRQFVTTFYGSMTIEALLPPAGMFLQFALKCTPVHVQGPGGC